VRQAEADEEKIEILQEKENYIDFLSKELSFNDQLLAALRSLQAVHESLNKAEQLASEKRIIDGLHMLEGGFWESSRIQSHMLIWIDAWKRLGDIPLEKSTRAMRLLDSRSFELRMQIHEQFATIWKELIHVKPDQALITINRVLPGEKSAILAMLSADGCRDRNGFRPGNYWLESLQRA
jgi:centromere/kinetochore protein ZW10